MRKRTLASVAALGLAGALALPTAAAASEPTDLTPFSFTRLTGAAEVPGPGDPDGRGFAFVRWDTEDGEVCYNLFVQRIQPAAAAHIHVGGAGASGPVVQDLAAPTKGYSSGCVYNPDLAAALAADPENYYVNVHNAEYPGGAVRGQLD
ncbi:MULTISPECIES: CHRD domain-containing protein [unclassified Microbacterium]|uniref:CHRD domain-containing protein n=1 Tax=unclassified Microbacterium TaxID=2609290 RepID=UPI000F54CFD3|nr:CHRD domain-containing protein [Microbacterium sp. ABRD28]AZC13995.1 CHRD domain-containing protein [Microbacterium sp. ABRD28]